MSAEHDNTPLLVDDFDARIVLHRTPLDWVAFIRGEEVAFFGVDQESVLHRAREWIEARRYSVEVERLDKGAFGDVSPAVSP